MKSCVILSQLLQSKAKFRPLCSLLSTKVFTTDSPTGGVQQQRDPAISVAKEPVRLFASIDLGNERVRAVLDADEMDHGPSHTSRIIRQASRTGAVSFAATFRWQGGSNFVFMGTSCLHVRSRTRY